METSRPERLTPRGSLQDLQGQVGWYAYNPSDPLAYGRLSVLFAALTEDGLRVCIKLFRDHLTTEAGDVDFNRELRVLKTLNHPSILPILDFGMAADGQPRPFLVMPLCKHGNLRTLLEERSFLPLDVALTYLRQIAGALDHSHQSGILHGDVKPENILLGEDGIVFLADFGAARYRLRVTKAPTTARETGAFTEYYASPEQVSRGVQSVRSDVYSFAVVAYELLTGRQPIDPTLPLYQGLEAKVHGRILQPLEANPALPAAAGRALMAGLAVDPKDRPSSAGELVLMIEKGFGGLAPTEAKLPSGDRDIFLVHGHDAGAKERVARFLERLGLRVTILHESVSRGKTLIEKVESYSGVTAAVVLLTPDDVGAALADRDHLQPRARQNVIFELGYFCAKLGRARTIALADTVELPSDLSGILHIPLDSAGSWRLELIRELRAAGLSVDANAVL